MNILKRFFRTGKKAKALPDPKYRPDSDRTNSSPAGGADPQWRQTRAGYWNARRPDDPAARRLCDADEKQYQALVQAPYFALENEVYLSNRQYSAHCRQLFESARESVLLCTAVFSSSPGSDLGKLAQMLARKARDGLKVQILVGSLAPSKHALTACRFLQREGVSMRIHSGQGRMHRNMLVVDAEHCVAGSHNWTPGSLFRNQEISLACRSTGLADTLTRDFMALWQQAGALELRALESTATTPDPLQPATTGEAER